MASACATLFIKAARAVNVPVSASVRVELVYECTKGPGHPPSHLINVYVSAVNVIQAQSCRAGVRELGGNPPELTISVGAPCTMHSPVSWTHPEGPGGQKKKKKKIQLAKSSSSSCWRKLLCGILASSSPPLFSIKIIIVLSALLRNTVNYLQRMNPFVSAEGHVELITCI